jgi:hypothetical protein
MPIDDFITQTIVTGSAPLGLPSLLIPLCAAVLDTDQNTAWIAEYTDDVDVVSLSPSTWAAALLALGVTAGDDLYEALTDMHSQRLPDGRQSAPDEILLARRSTAVAQVRTATVAIVAGAGNYTTTINGVDFVVAFSVDANTTATAIRAAINAPAPGAVNFVPVTASGAGAAVVLTADEAGVPFTSDAEHSTTPGDYTIANTTASNGIANDIATWRAQDDRWTFLLETTRSSGVITTAATTLAALTRRRLLVCQTDDALAQDGGSTADLASLLGSAGLGLEDVVVYYHDDDNEFADWAIVGKVCGAGLPGDYGWVHVGLQSVTGLTASQLTSTTALAAKRYNWLESYDATVPPTSSTRGGRTLGNSPVDIVQLIMDLNLRIPVRLYERLRNGNVPYTGGEPTVEAAIRQALGERTGPPGRGALVEGSIVVTVPPASEQTSEDALARLYDGVEWAATAQGKLEAVNIIGTLSQGGE